HDTFPDAQYIHIIRDGYDAIYSTVELGNRTLRQSIDIWKYSVLTMSRFQRRAGARVMEVRYEDLVRAPAPTVASVCRFLGVGYRSEMVTSLASAATMGDVSVRAHHRNVGSPVKPNSVGRGRSSWSNDERRFIARRIEPIQRRLGYNVAT